MPSKSTTSHTTPSQPDLSEYGEEAIPFDDVMRRLLEAKPQHQKADKPEPNPTEPTQ